MINIVMDGGIEAWGIEFIQWLEQQLDQMDGMERIGKSITDENVIIRIRPKLARTDHLMSGLLEVV